MLDTPSFIKGPVEKRERETEREREREICIYVFTYMIYMCVEKDVSTFAQR